MVCACVYIFVRVCACVCACVRTYVYYGIIVCFVSSLPKNWIGTIINDFSNKSKNKIGKKKQQQKLWSQRNIDRTTGFRLLQDSGR